MKIDIQDFLANLYVLSIDETRQTILKKCFAKYGIAINNIYQGFSDLSLSNAFANRKKSPKRLNGIYNCSLGHAAIIKLAKCLNLPFVVIFEDDAYPCIDVKNKLQKYLNEIPDDADVIAFGWNQYHEQPTQYNELYQVITNNIYGAHAYMIFQKAYNRYLEYYTKNPRLPADIIMNSFLNARFYKVTNPLFIQYNKNLSNGSCIGYMYEKNKNIMHSSNPPSGFEKIENIC